MLEWQKAGITLEKVGKPSIHGLLIVGEKSVGGSLEKYQRDGFK